MKPRYRIFWHYQYKGEGTEKDLTKFLSYISIVGIRDNGERFVPIECGQRNCFSVKHHYDS